MQTFGTGMRYRSEINTRWPENRGRDEGVKVPEVLPPLHTCEVPPEMYPTRERLAVKWAGRTPIIPLPAEKPKKAPAKRSRKRAA